MSYLPPDGGLSHLLNIVTDAKAVQDRIKQLQDATKVHLDAVQKNQELDRNVKVLHTELDGKRRQLDNAIIEHQNQLAVDKAYIQDRKRELENSFSELARRNEDLQSREQAVHVAKQNLERMHDTLVSREVDISTRTKMVEGREQQVQQHAVRNQALIDHLRQNGFLNI